MRGLTPVTVHMSFSLPQGSFKRQVTRSIAPGNPPWRCNFSPCEQNAKVASKMMKYLPRDNKFKCEREVTLAPSLSWGSLLSRVHVNRPLVAAGCFLNSWLTCSCLDEFVIPSNDRLLFSVQQSYHIYVDQLLSQ